MRYAGQGHEILVELPDGPFTADSVAELQKRFEAGYRALFNRVIPALDIEVVGWILRAEAPAPGRSAELPVAGALASGRGPSAVGTRSAVRSDAARFRERPGLCSRRAEARPVDPGSGRHRRGRDHHDHHLGLHRRARSLGRHSSDGPQGRSCRRPRNDTRSQPSAEPHRIPGDVEPPDLRRRGAGADPGAHRLRHRRRARRATCRPASTTRRAACWPRPSPARRAMSTRWR